jgi:transcriptional regulator with XRE-family HTH domain
MNEFEWIRAALHDRRISVVAERTGLSEPTIRAIRDSDNANPMLSTLQTLATYLKGVGE